MIPFLKQTAEFIHQEFAPGMDKLCVVLPNRRAGLFLRKHLAALTKNPVWSPVILSVEDFLGKISGLQEADTLTLLFELYTIHRDVAGSDARTFDDFILWAPQLISDFDETDRYLADPQSLFESLSEARAISLWNPDGRPLTAFQQKYLDFYRSLYTYHERLTTSLKAKGLAYAGMIYRVAAEQISSSSGEFPWNHVIFAGFNALTLAEETIIGTLREKGLATLLWDADRYYLDDPDHEAGDFLRKWFNRWPVREPRWISDNLLKSEKQITIVGAPDPLGQTTYGGSLLRELAGEGHADERTAVVLLDEGMLIPLLYAVPEEINALNITAGLPFQQTPLAGLVDLIFRMQTGSGRFRSLSMHNAGKFYFSDALKVLSHPYMQMMANHLGGGNRFAYDESVANLRNGNRVFIGLKDLKGEKLGMFAAALEFLDPVFTRWDDPGMAVRSLRSTIGNIRDALPATYANPDQTRLSDRDLHLEYLFVFSTIINRLEHLLTLLPSMVSVETLRLLFQQIAAGTSIPFSGEPLTGLQVLGMLETRVLDFENVIIMSCNDDRIPGGKPAGSFIPYDIKRAFGLPGYRQRDAVAAYHFYRLLQRAKRAWIIYITEPDRMGGGDRSRFLRQLSAELKKKNPQTSVMSAVLTSASPKGEMPPVVTIEKNSRVMARLLDRATRGYSATSLNAYRNCSLKFYYSEIAGLKEPDEMDETIGPAVFGTAIHEALQHLFKPFAGQPMTPGILQGMIQLADNAVDNAFDKKFKGSDVTFGRNLLLVHVAKMLVKRYLRTAINEVKSDPAEHSYSVNLLEQYVERNISIRQGTGHIVVKIKGLIDRVDRMAGWWRIIDYKTGNVVKKQVTIPSWEELKTDPGLNIGFQLMLYAWLLRDRLSGTEKIGSGVLPLRKINEGFLPLRMYTGETKNGSTVLDSTILDEFEQTLTGLLEEIHDSERPFNQTTDHNLCKKCPYINLCGR